MGPVADITESVYRLIEPHTGSIVARSIVTIAVENSGIDLRSASADDRAVIFARIDSGLRAFVSDNSKVDLAMSGVRAALGVDDLTSFNRTPVSSPNELPDVEVARDSWIQSPTRRRVDIREEYDIVTARGECKELCGLVGFTLLDQVKIATAVSELARNIVQYADSGHVQMCALTGDRRGVEVQAVDSGAGISNVDTILSGDYRSKTGMGIGLVGTRRLMDEFSIESGRTGTRILARKYLS